MSRNPYLAASRPTSSFTRSSRSSKRNDLTPGKSSSIGRSRSSASLGGFLSSSYAPTLSYSPSSSTTSTWQRPLSASRTSSRLATDPSTNATPSTASSTYRANEYTPSNRLRSTEPSRESRSDLFRSASSQDMTSSEPTDHDGEADDVSTNSHHLKNYQQSKIQEQQHQQQQASARTRTSLQSLNSDCSQESTRISSATSLNSSSLDNSLSGLDSAEHNDPGEARNGKALSKSRSLDIGQHQAADAPATIASSLSVDALLSRCELMSERELRKSYKELVVEYDRIRRHLQGIDDKEKQRQQEWIRKERQMQRKISELEEENRNLDEWKQEIQRLKDENRSLIRVVSKLSKQH